METNIYTINTKKNTGSLDLSFFTKLIDGFKYQLELCTETYNIIEDGLSNAIKNANLEYIDFSLSDNSDFVNGMMSHDSFLHGISVVGYDENYKYVISVNMIYEEEDDEETDYNLDDVSCIDTEMPDVCIPESIVVTIIRTNKQNVLDVSNFNFEKRKWEAIDVCKAFNYTENQVKLVSTGKGGIKASLFLLYHDVVGKISDKDFEKLYKEQKPLLDLYESVFDFFELQVLDDKTVCITNTSDCTGTAITYQDGKYKMSGCVIGDLLYTAFETKNMNEMRNYIVFMFDRKNTENIVASFPLSKYAFANLGNDGYGYFYFLDARKNKELTGKEEESLGTFMDTFNDLYVEGEDNEE